MRFRPASRAVIAGASLLATWAASARPALADILVGSTIIPTSSVMATSAYLPTSYVVPTSTYLPTSHVVPTSTYLPTTSILETGGSYYLPTSYVTSSYRGGLFRPRRFVERTSYYASPTSYLTPTVYSPTSYIAPTSFYSSAYSSALLPTSYVVPTVSTSALLPTTYLSRSYLTPTSYLVDDGLIQTSATSAACCDSGGASMAAPVEPAATPTRALAPRTQSAPSTGGNPITSQPLNGGNSQGLGERAPSSTTRQTPDEGFPSAVQPPVTSTPAPVTPTPRPPIDAGSPPDPDRPLDPLSLPPAGSLGNGARDPGADEGTNRMSYKPSNYAQRAGATNILRGKVVSFESGRPEEFVTVVLTNRSRVYEDRTTRTDADGEFKISLPDGDWTVKVAMPSGSVYPVGGSLTASAGRVIDPYGKNVAEMTITR